MEPEALLQHSQEVAANAPCPEPDEFSPQLLTLFPLEQF
jgi:hypothetical protein